MESNQILLETKLVGDIRGTFYVPSYQRGYTIVKEIAVLSEKTNGWPKQLNLISWNDATPNYDIRDWGPNREKMGKGVTLTPAELQSLCDALEKVEL